MRETTLTIEQIETIITGYPDSPYYIRRNLVVPNCNWGFLNHEADLLVLTQAKHLIEIEIKRTWADFMADFKKKHTHYDRKLSYFYYAVPLSIAERAFNWLYTGTFHCNPKQLLCYQRSKVTGYTENNPHKCGLIIYASQDEAYTIGERIGSCFINVMGNKLGDYYKVTQDEEKLLLRLLGLRVWKLKNKIAKLQNQLK